MPNRQYFNNGGVIGPNNDPQVSAEQITTFTSSGTFNPSAATAEVLLIGGGGGAGPNRGGGGGAGGLLHSPEHPLNGSPYPVSIGGGGGGGGGGPQNFPGSAGGQSTFDGHTALGGGFGAGHGGNSGGGAGGSGGGAGHAGGPGSPGPGQQSPSGPFTGHGNPGGAGGDPGAGGGGSGGTASPRNTGGQGKQFDIASPTDSPSQTHYASGGAGGRGSGPPTPGGGSTAAGGNNQGGGGGSHGPVRSGSYSGQGGYAVFKEPGGFAGASGVWTLSEVLDLVAAGNWSSS